MFLLFYQSKEKNETVKPPYYVVEGHMIWPKKDYAFITPSAHRQRLKDNLVGCFGTDESRGHQHIDHFGLNQYLLSKG